MKTIPEMMIDGKVYDFFFKKLNRVKNKGYGWNLTIVAVSSLVNTM